MLNIVVGLFLHRSKLILPLTFRLCKRNIIHLMMLVLLYSCTEKENMIKRDTLFELLDPAKTGVDFQNSLSYYKDFNIFTYRNFYNGGGVAIGDINNDGLADIYFTSNLNDNKLYLNKGNLQFEDITEKAGVEGTRGWSTGVTMADVNGDGWLDIYVCNSGNIEGDDRINELFINQKDGTFTEEGKIYGLDDPGYSNHASFFDYDKDGDLDVYLVNNSFQALGSLDQRTTDRMERDPLGGDKLLRNDIGESGVFVDVSHQANIYGSVIGFGLGAVVNDFDQDGWLDIYVCNDFFERDYMYMNNGDGTFSEELPLKMQSINQASMGVDATDLNGDGYPEIFVTEMLPKSEERFRTTMIFEDWDRYLFNLRNDYYHQFTRNTLQLNNCETSPQGISFSEIGRLAGVEATDWSWSALMVDLDNNGSRDIFVTNGIYQDILDQEFLNRISNDLVFRDMVQGQEVDFKKLIEAIPSNPIPNFAFSGNSEFHFSDSTSAWGLDQPGFSNGASYGDLDNDGDLDLVINNVNMPSFIYENKSNEKYPDHHYLKITLQGKDLNTKAIGAKIKMYANDQLIQVNQIPSRGFQSSVAYELTMGLGKIDKIDSIKVIWPRGDVSELFGISANQAITINEAGLMSGLAEKPDDPQWDFLDVTNRIPDVFKHAESNFSDFDQDALLFHMNSTEGPKIAVADINADGLDDIYLCGAKGFPGKLMVQQPNGSFTSFNRQLFEKDRNAEDTDAIFFDADNDSDLDLYVTSGSSEDPGNSPVLADRLYLNDGNGSFVKSRELLPTDEFEGTSCARNCDFDGDGDQDLFVGVRMENGFYGFPQNGYLLENDGQGHYRNVTAEIAPELLGIGMIKDARWFDYDNDQLKDLIVIGEWMSPHLFRNERGKFRDVTNESGLDSFKGWWNSVETADLDGDGDQDIVAGNHGLNSRFRSDSQNPLVMYVNDFDNDGTIEHILCRKMENGFVPFVQNKDLINQIPSLRKKLEDLDEITIESIFIEKQIDNAVFLEANFMETTTFMNQGDGTFTVQNLPVEAQLSPVYSIYADDVDGDGINDLLLGGNLYEVKPEAGRYDASYGLFLKGLGDGNFERIANSKSGLNIQGQVRDIKSVNIGEENFFLFVLNNDKVNAYKWNK